MRPCKVQSAKCREADEGPTRVCEVPVGEVLPAPKGWQYFTVHAITHHAETASGYEGKVAAEMIGAKFEESSAWAWNPLRDHVAKSTARPEFALIALVCAGYEKTIAKDSWRSPSIHPGKENPAVASEFRMTEDDTVGPDASQVEDLLELRLLTQARKPVR